MFLKRVACRSGKTSDNLGHRKAAQHVKFKESKMIRQISFITFLFTDLNDNINDR